MRRAPIAAWASFEVVLRGRDGKLDPKAKPFSGVLFSGDGDEITTALQKMRLAQTHGWPDARLYLKDKRGKPLVDRADDEKEPPIYLLKCKPGCWRLYFYVDSAAHRFTYLSAKCKKKQEREASDSVRARNAYNNFVARNHGLVEFRFP